LDFPVAAGPRRRGAEKAVLIFPRMAFLEELWAFLKERKKFWLLPGILAALLFGVLVIVTQGSAIAPFIYTLF
jgi:hypothetical protein